MMRSIPHTHPHILNRRRFVIRSQVGSRSGVASLILDTFTDTNGTLLTAHAIGPLNVPGTAWTPLSTDTGTNLLINAYNQVKVQATVKRAKVDAGVADCRLSCDFNTGQCSGLGSIVGLVLRATDTSNYWWAGMDKSLNLLRLVEVTSERAAASKTWADNTAFSLGVICSGDSIQASISGGWSGTIGYGFASFNNSVTKFGLYLSYSSTLTTSPIADNFYLESL
jgi:hypothetical protein